MTDHAALRQNDERLLTAISMAEDGVDLDEIARRLEYVERDLAKSEAAQ